MTDHISRQAAINTAVTMRCRCDTNDIDDYANMILAALEMLPTIDAVPVVRCKDCKHWGIHKRLNVPWCFEMHIDKSEDGYCDSGERREDATD